MTSRRTFLSTTLVIGIVLAVGCGGDSPTDTGTGGDYVLETYEGHSLPYTADGVTRVSGRLTLHTDGTYDFTVNAHLTTGGDASLAQSGTWRILNGKITMVRTTDSVTTTGKVYPDAIVFQDATNATYAFRKISS